MVHYEPQPKEDSKADEAPVRRRKAVSGDLLKAGVSTDKIELAKTQTEKKEKHQKRKRRKERTEGR